MKKVLFAVELALAASAFATDYSKGFFIVNEDWYGHQNSTVNYLLPDDPDGLYWQYRVFQTENPGHELGCTNQYGAIYDGRFYLIAKQEKDPGASVEGGRITVADARTMKMLHQSKLIDPSGAQCDGRAFIGVNKHKGYVSSSNGVWILNLDNYRIEGQVEGTANPNAGDDLPVINPGGSLYHGQTGSMVYTAGKLFVAHQSAGLLVVDVATDRVVDIISPELAAPDAGIGTIILDRSGMIWMSVSDSVQGTGTPLPYLIEINPETLETTVVALPSGVLPPETTWYAWTPCAFVSSRQSDKLYWKGSTGRFGAGTKVYVFDTKSHQASLLIDLETEGRDWKIYGCSLGVHPESDDIYMSLYHDFGTNAYITRRYSSSGNHICDYEMISNYWFPSLPVFPQDDSASGVELPELTLPEVTWDRGMLSLRNCQGTCRVYSVSGGLVAAFSVREAEERVPVPLNTGVYIVITSQGVTKILAGS